MGFSLNPKDLVKKVVQAPVAAVNKVADVASDGANVVKDVAGTGAHLVGRAATEAYHTGDYLLHNPPNPKQIARTTLTIGKGILTGKQVEMTGNLPDYKAIEPSALKGALERGKGRTTEQTFITGDRAGKSKNEPVSLKITGSKADLVKALEGQGWKQAPMRSTGEYATMGLKVLFGTEKNTNGPVSAQFLNGHEEVMAFNKNDDFNAGRDHLRIYDKGKDPETGEQRWEIAATRDIKVKVTVPHPDVDINPFDGDGLSIHEDTPKFTHEIDKNVDKERDYVMHDLLASGLVKDWSAVDGKRSGVAEEKLADGRYKVDNDLFTDGRVYEMKLGQ